MARGVRGILLSAAAAAVVLFASRSLLDVRGAEPDHPRLEPLAPLVGGTWRDERGSCTFRWGAEGRSILEHGEDADGAVEYETRYYWHPSPGPGAEPTLAWLSIRADGEVRQGIVRQDAPASLESRVNAFAVDGEGRDRNLRERIRFLREDRIVRSVHEWTPEEETLVEERTLAR